MAPPDARKAAPPPSKIDALRRDPSWLLSILESAKDAIITIDAEQRIVVFNRAAEEMFGYPADEVLGQPIDQLLPERFRAFHKNHIISFGETGITTRMMGGARAISGLRSNGEEFPIEASISQVDVHGQKLFTVIMRDITERRRAEQERAYMAAIVESSDDAITSKTLDGVITAWNMGAERLYQSTEETFPRSIEIQFDQQRELWAVSADPTQLHQFLMNLCVNARDAMSQGGTLSIRAENRVIDENYARMNVEAKPGAFVRISVADNGIGIDPALVDRIFEPFFTTKGIGKGTGLGLSTASTIVKSHGGFTNVYSELGKGTEIAVYLPACKEVTEQPAIVKAHDLPTGQGELILVVDDEEAIREITKGTLEAFCYRVLLAGEGTEALAMYAENKDAVRVVITDMMMPFMDGVATIRALRKMSPDVKVISTSGLADNAKMADAASAGVQTFLPKPYTAEQLLRTLAKVLHGK